MGKKGYLENRSGPSLLNPVLDRPDRVSAHISISILIDTPPPCVARTTLATMSETSSHTFLLRRHTLLPVDKVFFHGLD